MKSNYIYNYTIIIPHKNVHVLLERCLESIPIRSDLQVIVVDDNSCECRSYLDSLSIKFPHVLFLYTTEGRGAGFARNKGLERAEGKWLIFADSDDYFANGFNDILQKNINNCSDIVYHHITSVHSDTQVLSSRHYSYENQLSTSTDGLLKYGMLVPWGKIILHDIVRNNHIRFDETIAGNDIMFSVRIGHCASVLSVSESVLYVLTERKGSLTNSNSFTLYIARLKSLIRYNQYLCQINQYRYVINLSSWIINAINYGYSCALTCLSLILTHLSLMDILKILRAKMMRL